MTDITLYRIREGQAQELPKQAATVEKSLQTLIEANLETLLGVRFLATEYSTGPKHRGRIDTLGIDENGRPVIIEYKRASNENSPPSRLKKRPWPGIKDNSFWEYDHTGPNI